MGVSQWKRIRENPSAKLTAAMAETTRNILLKRAVKGPLRSPHWKATGKGSVSRRDASGPRDAKLSPRAEDKRFQGAESSAMIAGPG
jgi:hypothetical protein